MPEEKHMSEQKHAPEQKHVIIIGGGIIGVTSALYLHNAGYKVTLLEKESHVADGVSHGNNALITPSLTGPLASPDLPKTYFSYLGNPHSPFHISLKVLPDMLSWGVQFLWNCRHSTWLKTTRSLLEFSLVSQQLLQQTRQDYPLPYDDSHNGVMRIFRDQAGFQSACEGTKQLDQLGIRTQILNPDECRHKEPELASADIEIKGGIFYPDDEGGDSKLYARALADLLEQQGVTIRYQTEAIQLKEENNFITGVEVISQQDNQDNTNSENSSTNSKGHENNKELLTADYVVLATAFVPDALKKHPVLRPLKINPIKGYSFTVQLKEHHKQLTLPVIEDKRKIGVTPLGDRIRVAARAEFRGHCTSVNTDTVERMHQYFCELFPEYRDAEIIDRWSGLRPVTTSGIPYISQTAVKGLFLNLGHGHLGWTLANASGRLLTDLISDTSPVVDAVPFSVNRAY